MFFEVNYDEENDTLSLDTEEFFEEYGEEYYLKFKDIIADPTDIGA